ncbi:tRNA-dihydrouridine synthase [Demequina muriae]|uniref:tRNA-dihydrouridine synthase n=1 Tax=Demequina muriae TaxID=3051664 RepID=A0ABT8GKB8_9MICO|nr:tRNA-dihydrouridine synthase [Demequina sp. EGI L300058]MDN4481809.1 tRNA-dihydrouridine synthase [Demequina sp. EGI L300058]
MDWWFDPRRTYDDNVRNGPFGPFDGHPPERDAPTTPAERFLGHTVRRPFGIAAGPLPTARHCAAAFSHGFDVNVYKTVRSRAMPAHPFPNTLAVRVDGDLCAEPGVTLLVDGDLDTAHSISNSYGVPSPDPDQWQPDMAAAAASAANGQVLVGSCQGTRDGDDTALIADYARTAQLVAETGAGAVELNLSCPNEGTGALLCFDTPLVARVARAAKERIGDVPLVLKIAYFRDDDALASLVRAVAPVADGIAAVNTLPALLVDAAGRQALPGPGRETAGVCGASIRWAGLDMVRRLARHREASDEAYTILGVGGVLTADDYETYRHAGADAVMTATGAMRDASLGRAVSALAR